MKRMFLVLALSLAGCNGCTERPDTDAAVPDEEATYTTDGPTCEEQINTIGESTSDADKLAPLCDDTCARRAAEAGLRDLSVSP